MGSAVTGSVYHRSYPALKRPVFSFMWRVLTIYTSFYSVLITLPWQTVKALAPGGVKNTMMEVENTVLSILIPFCNFWQDAWYQLFSTVDSVSLTVHNNVMLFSENFSREVGTLSNRILSILEDRTSVLQDYGIYAFHLLFHAGLFAPHAVRTTSSTAGDAAKGAAQGMATRVAKMGDAISTHPAGAGPRAH